MDGGVLRYRSSNFYTVSTRTPAIASAVLVTAGGARPGIGLRGCCFLFPLPVSMTLPLSLHQILFLLGIGHFGFKVNDYTRHSSLSHPPPSFAFQNV